MEWLTAALGIGVLATAAGYGFMRGRVGNLREQLEDARSQIGDLKGTRTELESRAGTLETDLAALTRVVTGETHWVAIGHQLDEHHEKAMAHWAIERGLLTEIRDGLYRWERHQ